MTAEIFVLNYNGRAILEECLPSLVHGAELAGCPLTVIDNVSTDDSVEFLKKQFPRVRVQVTPKNTVLCAFNDAARASTADVVFLLNNDLKADGDFVTPLVKVFEEHPDAFLAGPKTFTFDGKRYEGSLAKMHFRYGFFGAESRFPGHESRIERAGVTMQSGFGAYHRARFLELGGFDDLYLPGTVEDSDLCFRAWKRGWRCYYEPTSRLYHKGQATFGATFGRTRLKAINQRNVHLFIWKNLSGGYFLRYLLWLPFRPLLFLLMGRIEFIWGLLWSLPRIPRALARRFRLPAPHLSDGQVFAVSEAI